MARNFDASNRAVKEAKNNQGFHPLSSDGGSVQRCGTSAFWLNYRNNQAFYKNNGQHSEYYSKQSV